MNRRVGIVVCSHLKSSRLPRKAFREIGGVPVIVNLLGRLNKTGIDTFVAVPREEWDEYEAALPENSRIYWGNAESPLHRMAELAVVHRLDVIIRVCHDKILVDPDTIVDALERYTNQNQYLYSSHLPDGAGFEIFSRHLLEKAAKEFEGQNVEHVSYAIRYFKPEMIDYVPRPELCNSDARLLLDYPEDETLMKILLRDDPNISLQDALDFLDMRPSFMEINKLPLITFYTCAYNASKTINATIQSVRRFKA
jgi:spore coat polysaccharide biosynthesis protein SpsF (cytidylyltransferase family)